MTAEFLRDEVLGARGIPHGFGLRTSPEIALRRPRQVHGARVVWACARESELGEADAVLTRERGARVGVLTADCVPILVAAGDVVGAVHAGWRGLAAGVIESALAELSQSAPRAEISAAIGPCIGACCYEVDAPVLAPLRARYGRLFDAAVTRSQGERAQLDLGALAQLVLARGGVAPRAIGIAARACTRCDAARFHSFRRNGAAAGRLAHWIEAAS
ncbi:MAG TPA: polyphenol oxidase family protein [Myxococcota bacterium]|nr:polyphenol oxidase family protein [Myxococcota bacterium]